MTDKPTTFDKFVNTAEDYLDDGKINQSTAKPYETTNIVKNYVQWNLGKPKDVFRAKIGMKQNFEVVDGLRYDARNRCCKSCIERRYRPVLNRVDLIIIPVAKARILLYCACLLGNMAFLLLACLSTKDFCLALGTYCAFNSAPILGWPVVIWFFIRVYRNAQKNEGSVEDF